MNGIKFDSGKPSWILMPLGALDDAVKVLMHGARKYAPDNWMKVKPKERYFDACIRHLSAWQRGERLDPESGLPHLAHALCSLIFLSWHDKEENK